VLPGQNFKNRQDNSKKYTIYRLKSPKRRNPMLKKIAEAKFLSLKRLKNRRINDRSPDLGTLNLLLLEFLQNVN
jgi:hypothetical protein